MRPEGKVAKYHNLGIPLGTTKKLVLDFEEIDTLARVGFQRWRNKRLGRIQIGFGYRIGNQVSSLHLITINLKSINWRKRNFWGKSMAPRGKMTIIVVF